MGFLSKLKQTVNVITGGAAKVTIEWNPQTVVPGQPIAVKVTAGSTGSEVKSDGIFVDVFGRETIMAPPKPPPVSGPPARSNSELDALPVETVTAADTLRENPVEPDEPETDSRTFFTQSFQLCGSFVLGANETKQVEGTLALPANLPPSRDGDFDLAYRIRGRLEAFGNDPDSGYKEIHLIAGPSSNDSGPADGVEI